MEPIQIIGIKHLDEIELESVNRIANRYYAKIQRGFKKEISITIYIKAYEKQGVQKKYSVHIKVLAPTGIFASTKNSDWRLENAMHKSLEHVMKIIQHSLHTDDQHRKPSP